MKFLACSKLSDHRYKTSEGYLVCVDSILSRTGAQSYTRDELFHDGCKDEVNVDRSPDEVFSDKTLASFENKPLTIEHPDEDVNSTNHNKYAVGFIRDIKRGKDGADDVMLGTIVVTDEDAIDMIESGKLKELSCGYDCDIEDVEHPCQRNIRGNHVALCEHGRAGIARIVDSVKDVDPYKEATNNLRKESNNMNYVVGYVDKSSDKAMYITVEASSKEEAINKVKKLYRPYRIFETREVKDMIDCDNVKDMKVSHDNFRERPVFILQSDVDKNLFFYIGETHAMKEGEYTYTQYDMEGMTPNELRKELEANGWHKVTRGPAPFIDEDPYKESTRGREEAEKKLHDEMIYNRDRSIKDAKTEYVFNYQDTYHRTRDKIRVDADNLDEAIHKFGDLIAMAGIGTANAYVISVSPNDGFMRAYGKLSDMLKQSWVRDRSTKDSVKKVHSIIRIISKVHDAKETTLSFTAMPDFKDINMSNSLTNKLASSGIEYARPTVSNDKYSIVIIGDDEDVHRAKILIENIGFFSKWN